MISYDRGSRDEIWAICWRIDRAREHVEAKTESFLWEKKRFWRSTMAEWEFFITYRFVVKLSFGMHESSSNSFRRRRNTVVKPFHTQLEPSNSPFILESNTFDIPLILTWFEKEKPHAIIKCMVNWVKECTCYRHIRLSCVSKHSLLIKNAFHDFRAIGQYVEQIWAHVCDCCCIFENE